MNAPATRDADFIHSRIQVDPDTACWVWQGHVGVRGTRAVYNNEYAYRISYRIFVEDIPQGMQINHHCDNGLCVNPEHLYVGTQRENARDMWSRGRGVTPSLSGEQVWNAYSDELVDSVRARYAAGEQQAALAAEYSVALSIVRRWCSGGARDRAPIRKSRRPNCGTRNGYCFHKRHKEAVCEPCYAAQAAYMTAYKAKRAAARIAA